MDGEKQVSEQIPSYLYFLIEVPDEGEQLSPWTKIGKAGNVDGRKTNLRQGNPRQLDFVRVYKFETGTLAAVAEYALQTEFKDRTSAFRPDWFKVPWQEVDDRFQAIGNSLAPHVRVETGPA